MGVPQLWTLFNGTNLLVISAVYILVGTIVIALNSSNRSIEGT